MNSTVWGRNSSSWIRRTLPQEDVRKRHAKAATVTSDVEAWIAAGGHVEQLPGPPEKPRYTRMPFGGGW